MPPPNKHLPPRGGPRLQGAGDGSVNILLAYPKTLTGRLIAESLSHNSRFRMAGHVSSPDAVTAFSTHASVDVALIAVDLCGEADGLESLRRICAEHSEIRTIMLLDDPDPHLVVECFRMGAKGVFTMANNGSDLLWKCILCVFEGQIWASSQELHWIVDALKVATPPTANVTPIRPPRRLELSNLSKREEHVVSLLADGLSNRDIARTLDLSENTIKNYLFRIFGKVGVSNRTELLLQARGLPTRSTPDRGLES